MLGFQYGPHAKSSNKLQQKLLLSPSNNRRTIRAATVARKTIKSAQPIHTLTLNTSWPANKKSAMQLDLKNHEALNAAVTNTEIYTETQQTLHK
jgi:hypothetical protein